MYYYSASPAISPPHLLVHVLVGLAMASNKKMFSEISTVDQLAELLSRQFSVTDFKDDASALLTVKLLSKVFEDAQQMQAVVDVCILLLRAL